MKKGLFLTLLSVVMFSLRVSAQSSLLATLNHEGTISTYYGASALQQAYNAATHGDVITLSSGSFLGTDIKKAITLRGAGMQVDTVSHTEPTVITNNFTIDISDTLSHRLTMEGIYSNQSIKVNTLKNAMFLKCRFYDFEYSNSSSSKMVDLNFIHCRIASYFRLANGSAAFTNCVVNDINLYNGSPISLTNCYTKASPSQSNSEFKNCIIVSNYSYGTSTSTYYNNLYIGPYDLNSPNNTNVEVKSNDERIQFLTGDYSDDKDYVLTDAVRTLIKGTDGTEVGIHGGSLPYDPTPTNPQITKFNVAAKSTADGKLSVDIEVNSAN